MSNTANDDQCLEIGTQTAEKVNNNILEFVADFTIPAQPQFVVAEKFTDNGTVKFWSFSSNFQKLFMPMTEKEVGEMAVTISKLRVQAKHADMTPELGERRVLTTSQLYWMLAQQPNGEKPDGKNRRLLTDRYVNVRILDMDDIERAVRTFWFEGYGWRVDADDLDYQDEWFAGNQVFSRK